MLVDYHIFVEINTPISLQDDPSIGRIKSPAPAPTPATVQLTINKADGNVLINISCVPFVNCNKKKKLTIPIFLTLFSTEMGGT